MQYFWKRKIYVLLIIISFLVIGITSYLDSIHPFSSILVEINSSISLNDFFIGFSGDAKMLTSLHDISTEKLGTYDVNIKLFGRTYHTKVEVIDTKKPIVTLKDVKLGLKEEITPELFIEDVKDDTPYQVEFVEEPKKEPGKQKVKIKVIDSCLNETIKEATLEIGKVRETFTLEAGENFKIDMVLFDPKEFKEKKIVQKIDSKKLGEQDLILELDKEKYTVKVTVQDTKKPVVKTRNVTIYWDEKVSIDDFLVKVTDGTRTKKE